MRSLVAVLAVALASASCAATRDEPVRAAVAARPPASDALALRAEAERAHEALRAGRLPAALDALVERLVATAATEPPARAAPLREAAAVLVASRFALTRDARDRARAEALLEPLSRGADALACGALAQLAEVHERAGDRDATRAALLAYGTRCPHGPAAASARARLAALDPSVAIAAAEAARPAQRGARAGSLDALFAPVPRGRYRRIVLDPGHGGSDPGARGPTGLTEASVTLDVARRLADALSERTGAQVLLTRDADEYVPLETRAARANDARADLFVSLHCNSSVNPESRGISTYVLDTSGDVIAARLARREEGEQVSDPRAGPEVFRVLAGLRLDAVGGQSQRLAASLQQAMLRAVNGRYGDAADLGVHGARFSVLVGARMPAVLVELSFVSNPLEEARLRDPAYRDLLVGALARAIARAE